ncbi:MAG: xylulokinase [Oscillospiraceae bacterium]|jgi:xylulokinase|nr:xylulokinase [Oscillospiraceae bacterium]
MQFLMGIDIGTSGTKTAIFDFAGKLLASHTENYPMYQPRNGYAEQDADDWWNASVTGIRATLAAIGGRAEEIAGVGLSGQMHGLVMLDKQGTVLRRPIIWCDQRTAEECAEITSLVGKERLIEITANPALTGFTASKILWVRKHEPQIFEQCAHILLPKDYIRYCLTGEFATEVSDASGMQLLDIAKRRWSDEVLDRLSIEKSLLGTVYESPEITGKITAAAAALTGLCEGTPVVGGAGDNAAAAVGAGVVKNGTAFTTIGTSGVVFAHTDQMAVDPLGRVHTFCCAVPGAWHAMGVTQAAGLSRQWFQEQFCAADETAAKSEGRGVYELFDEALAAIPIGANRLFYLPYLMGERTPHLDPNARGVFFGLSAMHTRHDLLRAVTEGVSFSLRDCIEILREMGIHSNEMVACGGGANSALWRQMLSDLFGCGVKVAASTEGAALGAALLAGTGAGVYESVPDACEQVVRYHNGTSPNAENALAYEKHYEFYKGLYPALAGEFQKLSKL